MHRHTPPTCCPAHVLPPHHRHDVFTIDAPPTLQERRLVRAPRRAEQRRPRPRLSASTVEPVRRPRHEPDELPNAFAVPPVRFWLSRKSADFTRAERPSHLRYRSPSDAGGSPKRTRHNSTSGAFQSAPRPPVITMATAHLISPSRPCSSTLCSTRPAAPASPAQPSGRVAPSAPSVNRVDHFCTQDLMHCDTGW